MARGFGFVTRGCPAGGSAGGRWRNKAACMRTKTGRRPLAMKLNPWEHRRVPAVQVDQCRTMALKPPNGLEPLACGLQDRIQDDVNQCYFRFYDDPQERLGAAFTHIRTTDPHLAKLLRIWPELPTTARNVLVALARMKHDVTPHRSCTSLPANWAQQLVGYYSCEIITPSGTRSKPGVAALEKGTKLSPYEILSPLGAGGYRDLARRIDRRLHHGGGNPAAPPRPAGTGAA